MSQQGPENKGRDIWSRLGQTLKAGAETLVQETKELTKIGKLKVELMSLENERGRKWEEIGRAAHTLHKTGAMLPPELFELLRAADEVEARIAEKSREIELVRAEPQPEKPQAAQQVSPPGTTPATPPAPAPAPLVEAEPAEVVVQEHFFCGECGARVEPGNVYCGKCGAKLQ